MRRCWVAMNIVKWVSLKIGPTPNWLFSFWFPSKTVALPSCPPRFLLPNSTDKFFHFLWGGGGVRKRFSSEVASALHPAVHCWVRTRGAHDGRRNRRPCQALQGDPLRPCLALRPPEGRRAGPSIRRADPASAGVEPFAYDFF